MADALLIADLAGREELARVQLLYMKKQPSPYMRVVKAIQGNDFVSESLLCCSFIFLLNCTAQHSDTSDAQTTYCPDVTCSTSLNLSQK